MARFQEGLRLLPAQDSWPPSCDSLTGRIRRRFQPTPAGNSHYSAPALLQKAFSLASGILFLMAEMLRLGDVHDPIANIREWQSRQSACDIDDTQQTSEYSEVARLCSSLQDLFREINRTILEQNSVSKEAQISIERSRRALVLWSEGYGIVEGRLNEAFSKSRKLRCTVLKTLSHIGNVLTDSKLCGTMWRN